MFKIPRQSYTGEFKREAVRMVEAVNQRAKLTRNPG